MQDSYSHCAALVREADKDRFLASLFAPAERRQHLFALYAFNIEISRIREVTHEALPGEMRMQWWRDTLSGRGYGEVKQNPVAAALLDTMARFRLSATPLMELMEARRFDLYEEPMATFEDFEAYARRTSSSLIALAAAVLVGSQMQAIVEPARHAGIAYAYAGLLRAFPLHTVRRQLYLPLDLLAHHGVTREAIFRGDASAGLRAALAEIREGARTHLQAFAAEYSALPPEAGPAFLPAALVEPQLALMGRIYYDPYSYSELPQWRRQWTLWRAAWGGYLKF